MIFVVSGEGPSDIGVCENGQGECAGKDFRPGPMAAIIDNLVEPIIGFPPLVGAIEFVSEARRLEISKDVLPRSYLMGKKHEYGEGYYFKEARAIAYVAKEKAKAGECRAAAILFRDADSNKNSRYETVWKSINDGFKAEEFEDYGVPMVPKPTSEAWLICALKSVPYQNCAALEDTLSGSGKGRYPAKATLESLLVSRGKNVEDLVDMVADGTISPHRINMPSFERFCIQLRAVASRMLR
jgi:hypothetical protein